MHRIGNRNSRQSSENVPDGTTGSNSLFVETPAGTCTRVGWTDGGLGSRGAGGGQAT